MGQSQDFLEIGNNSLHMQRIIPGFISHLNLLRTVKFLVGFDGCFAFFISIGQIQPAPAIIKSISFLSTSR